MIFIDFKWFSMISNDFLSYFSSFLTHSKSFFIIFKSYQFISNSIFIIFNSLARFFLRLRFYRFKTLSRRECGAAGLGEVVPEVWDLVCAQERRGTELRAEKRKRGVRRRRWSWWSQKDVLMVEWKMTSKLKKIIFDCSFWNLLLEKAAIWNSWPECVQKPVSPGSPED